MTNLRIIAFGAFGDALSESVAPRPKESITPPVFKSEQILSHSAIAFTIEDGKEYFKSFMEKKLWQIDEKIVQDLLVLIMSFTGGHAGLFVRAVRDLYEIYKNDTHSLTFDHICDKVMSTPFRIAWMNSRACKPVKSVASGSAEDQVLSAICFTGGLTIKEIAMLLPTYDDFQICKTIKGLVEKFLLVENVDEHCDSKFAFPAKLIQDFYLRHKFGATIRPSQEEKTFDAFIEEVLALMDGKTLRNCMSKSSNGCRLEAAYQKEFYRVAYQLLGDGIISCEAGALFGTKGRIDFWINDNRKWAVELLRDGDRLDDHVKRMTPDGKYGAIVREATNTLIIDFRGPNSPPTQAPFNPPDHYLLACFDNRFEFVELRYANGSVKKIKLVEQPED